MAVHFQQLVPILLSQTVGRGTNEMKRDHIPILLLGGKGNILWSLKAFLEEGASQGASKQLFSM